jgi:hypothetical protein
MRDCAVHAACFNSNSSVADPQSFSIGTLERTSKGFLAWIAVERTSPARPRLIQGFLTLLSDRVGEISFALRGRFQTAFILWPCQAGHSSNLFLGWFDPYVFTVFPEDRRMRGRLHSVGGGGSRAKYEADQP